MVSSLILFILLMIFSYSVVLTSPGINQISGNGIHPFTLVLLIFLFIISIIFVKTFLASASIRIARLKPSYRYAISIVSFAVCLLLFISGIRVYYSLKAQYPRPYIQYLIPLPFKIWEFWAAFILLNIAFACLYSRTMGKIIIISMILIPVILLLGRVLMLHGNPFSKEGDRKAAEDMLRAGCRGTVYYKINYDWL